MLGWTWFHFWRSCKDWRKSFFHQFQKSFAKCWTLRHLLREYRSARLKSPGGGRRTFDFIVSRWSGVSGSCEDSIVNLSVVSGLLLTIASASYMKVRSNSSSNCWPELCKSAHKIAWTERICLSQTPPLWLADGGFVLNLHQSQPQSRRKLWILALSISATAFSNSDLVPTKLVPRSERISLVGPWQLRNHHRALRNESVVRHWLFRDVSHVRLSKWIPCHIFSALVIPLWSAKGRSSLPHSR